MMILPLKMMTLWQAVAHSHYGHARRWSSKNDELCIRNEEFCIKTEGLCIKNDESCRRQRGLARDTWRKWRTSLSSPWTMWTLRRLIRPSRAGWWCITVSCTILIYQSLACISNLNPMRVALQVSSSHPSVLPSRASKSAEKTYRPRTNARIPL